MDTILIVEDDDIVAELIKDGLSKRGLQAKTIKDFENITITVHLEKPSLILMDIYLPYRDGYYWTRKIREFSTTPIIFLSSAEEKLNTVAALNAGADDFISKPFDFEMLSVKVKSLLRRTYEFDQIESNLHFEGYTLNLVNSQLEFESQTIILTNHELVILRALFENAGHIVSKHTLMTALWNNDDFVDENALQVNLARLRKKIHVICLDQFIKTRRGQGYILGDI
ncbi:response regulator transcription factor [Lactiplantibacillus pentosus]|jgi:DNA-binding response OmpR family regulator|uniref:response regulator transcription factor n=1 Tax=Lactiplantibacillus pentosus TaxID=1589 RepID=UPI002349597F|nr:response regulator transcription factor [Lactiplantibacillus pentosus]MDC6398384.1 response regulator transcription factor [Lactiplantibacillus pentosus]